MRISENVALVASLQFGIGSRYDCHVYAIRTEQGVVLIDSGSGVATPELLRAVDEEFPGATVAAIVLTHAHPDHACGAAPLQSITSCKVYCPVQSFETILKGAEEDCGLVRARQRGLYPDTVRLTPCHDVEPYSEGVLTVAGRQFTSFHVRGHSADSHCLMSEVDGRRTLFCGDVLFYGAILGVINEPDSGMQGYEADLPKLAGLQIDALFPGHGLFTLSKGQRHIDLALDLIAKGVVPRQIGQFDLIF